MSRFGMTNKIAMSTALSKIETFRILKEIQHGDLTTIKQVVQKDPLFHWKSLSYEKTGDTPLHCAARLGFTNILEYLLSNFTPTLVDIRNKDSKTALHEAAQFAQYESCRTLLKYRADVNAIKRADWTPLMLACTKINVNGQNNFKTISVLLDSGAMVNYQNKDGWTALHLICREGDLDILNELIKHGLEVRNKTKNGRTALHIAALHGNLEVVKELVLKYNLDGNECDNCGNTALHEAVLGRSIKICQFLMSQNDKDIFSVNKSDLNLLHLAASEGDLEVINYLVQVLKFDVNCKNKSGWTALHCAARKNKENAFDILINQYGASENIKDNFGREPREYFSNNNN